MLHLQDIDNAGMLDAYICKAPVQEIEDALDSFRKQPDKYHYLKAKVVSLRGVQVHIEHDYPRIRSVA